MFLFFKQAESIQNDDLIQLNDNPELKKDTSNVTEEKAIIHEEIPVIASNQQQPEIKQEVQ